MTSDSGPDVNARVTLDRIAAPVEHRIEALLATEIARWRSMEPGLVEPLECLQGFVMSGGKRLRPAFCYWAFIGAGGDPLEPSVIDTGAALEMLHSFALIHDDVMDDSRRRRGNDSVHAYFEKRHDDSGWAGETRRFGEGVAVLIGDMAFVYADHLMRKVPASAFEVFTELRVELNIGQYLDLWATVRSDADPELTKRIARYKSGKYTVERPMHLGAALAGRFDDLASGFSAYGLPVGEAFQLRDDILGAFGDTDLTGKPVGGDLREGKTTTILAIARRRAQGSAARLLAERYGAHDLADDEVAELQKILTETGARADTEAHIDQLVETGIRALEGLEITPASREHLAWLAHFVAGREY